MSATKDWIEFYARITARANYYKKIQDYWASFGYAMIIFAILLVVVSVVGCVWMYFDMKAKGVIP